MFIVALGGFVVFINWATFLYAATRGHLLQSSLGYFLSPIFSVIIGYLFNHESLNRGQVAAFGIAFLSLLLLIWNNQTLPDIALIIGLSFSFYGLIKSKVKISALESATAESFILSVFALIFGAYILFNKPDDLASIFRPKELLLLIGMGVFASVPIIWFGKAAKLVPVSTLGFMLYVAPTIHFLAGIFINKENFDFTMGVSFLGVWIALGIFLKSRKSGVQAKNEG